MNTHFDLDRRTLIKGSLVLVAGFGMGISVGAQVVSMNDAINKAGRQRMLSQRMAKAWLATGQGVDPQRAEKVMSESMALFDRQLVELKAFAPTADIKATYASLDSVWSDYKAVLVGHAPDRGAAPELLALDAKVLHLTHLGTVQIEKHSGQSIGRLVNLAGRQRMLSQRMAKFYLSRAWGVAAPNQLQELDQSRNEFRSALQELANAQQATAAIRDQLEIARQQWVFFDNALARAKDTAGAATHAKEVFASSENILQVMDLVTGMYSKLG